MMGVLIPSVMALRETAMTAPLGQQGEPLPSSALVPRAPSPKGRLLRTDCDRGESLEGATPVCATLRYDCHRQSLLFQIRCAEHHWFAMTTEL